VNLYEQQALNRRRTIYVMIGFVAFLLFLGLGFDYVYFSTGAGAPVPIGTTFALLYGGGTSTYSYFNGDRAVLASATALAADEAYARAGFDDGLRIRQFQNVVEEMAIAAGLPVPKMYVVPDPDPNAFATGRDPEHASIAVTRGLLELLNREQLQGVVAHEMAHIKNYDIRLMTIVAALVGAVALISDFTLRAWRSGTSGSSGGSSSRSSRDKKGAGALVLVLLVVWALAIILAPLVARILATMVSRRREFLADATGAELTRNPVALAEALERIEAAAGATKAIKQGSAHLCIADPLERKVTQKHGWLADLLATHPPMAERIDALRRMAYV
jgi:heat shock protein HtpX